MQHRTPRKRRRPDVEILQKKKNSNTKFPIQRPMYCSNFDSVVAHVVKRAAFRDFIWVTYTSWALIHVLKPLIPYVTTGIRTITSVCCCIKLQKKKMIVIQTMSAKGKQTWKNRVVTFSNAIDRITAITDIRWIQLGTEIAHFWSTVCLSIF